MHHVQAPDTAALEPSFWFQYMTIWPHNLHKLNVLCQPNGIRLNIQFTMRQEEGGQLPFLDIYIYSNENEFSATLCTCVWQTPTST
jgi:hypothetical protein